MIDQCLTILSPTFGTYWRRQCLLLLHAAAAAAGRETSWSVSSWPVIGASSHGQTC